MIKNYIFDLGNVLAEFNPEKLTAPFADGEDKMLISKVVFDRLYWNRLDSGTIEDDEVKKCIMGRLPESLIEIGLKVYDNWIQSLTPVDGMQALVRDIKKAGGRLYLLSNTSVGFANGYNKSAWLDGLLKQFDGMVFSAVCGMTKPGADIFEYLIKKYGLKAEESIFIDDLEKNVEGAQKVGIKGYLFDGDAEKLREFINI